MKRQNRMRFVTVQSHKTNFMNNNIKSLAWKSVFPSLNLTSKDIVGLSVNSLNVVEKIPIRSLLQER